MSNQAIVTIDGRQWIVSVATETADLVSGLSGYTSIPGGTGMLFDMGSDQSVIPINMSEMLFALDIVFINSTEGVIGVLHDVQPGDEAQFQAGASLGARYFLEMNAGEAEDIIVGYSVDLGNATAETTTGIDIDNIMNLMITMMIVVMMMKAMGGALKPAPKRPLIYGPRGEVLTHHSSPSSVATFPVEARKDLTFCKHMWDLEETIGRPFTSKEVAKRWESWKGLRYRSKTEEERQLTHELKYGNSELPERRTGLLEHHSIHGPERKKLVDEFGTWAVGRAESVCPEDDVACVRREAGRLIYAHRRSFTG